MLRSWFRKLSPARGRAAWHYRRGMLRAKRGQHTAALEDYGAVIELEHVDEGMLAMALYNRALVYDAQGNRPGAVTDLKRLLLLNAAAERVKTEARRRLVRMDQKLARSDALLNHETSPDQGTKDGDPPNDPR